MQCWHAVLLVRTGGVDAAGARAFVVTRWAERSNAEPGTSSPTSTTPTPPMALPKRSTAASNTYAAPPSDSETSATTSLERSSKPEDSNPNYTPNYEEPVIDAAVRMACWSESLSAFVGVCMVLNRQSSFDLFSQEECRDRAHGVRSEMLVRLTEWRQHNDNIPARRAEALIRAADPGCDNPAEAALLWVVKSVCAFEVVTQYEIVVNGRRYFADIAIPGLMIIFEFDGIGKLGKNDADFAQAKREWIQRENDLRSAGWTIYRVSWPDYEDLVRLRAWVTELLAPYQASIPASAQRLWAVPTQACDGPNRRFHMGASRRRSQGSRT